MLETHVGLREGEMVLAGARTVFNVLKALGIEQATGSDENLPCRVVSAVMEERYKPPPQGERATIEIRGVALTFCVGPSRTGTTLAIAQDVVSREQFLRIVGEPVAHNIYPLAEPYPGRERVTGRGAADAVERWIGRFRTARREEPP